VQRICPPMALEAMAMQPHTHYVEGPHERYSPAGIFGMESKHPKVLKWPRQMQGVLSDELHLSVNGAHPPGAVSRRRSSAYFPGNAWAVPHRRSSVAPKAGPEPDRRVNQDRVTIQRNRTRRHTRRIKPTTSATLLPLGQLPQRQHSNTGRTDRPPVK
jgi:hypothetical protein